MKKFKTTSFFSFLIVFTFTVFSRQTLYGQWTPTTTPANINPNPIYVHETITGNGLYVGKGTNALLNIAIGYGNPLNAATTGSRIGVDNVAIGNEAMIASTENSRNVAIGYKALRNLITRSTGSDSWNVAIGPEALSFQASLPAGAVNAGGGNVAIGYGTMKLSFSTSTTLNSDNVAMGGNALFNNNGNNNIAFGNSSLYSNQSGHSNLAVGENSLYQNTAGIGNIAIGPGAMQMANPTYGFNIGIGFESLKNATKDFNVGIGYQALANTAFSGTKNVGIGFGASVPSLTGNSQLSIQNVIYGQDMTGYLTMPVGNVSIGAPPVATTSGGIANNSTSGLSTGSYTRLQVAGTLGVLNVPNTTNTIGNYLFVDANGVVNQAVLPSTIPNIATSTCTNQNYIPKVNANGSNALTCSQIYDDGTASGVGIGTASGFVFVGGGTPYDNGFGVPSPSSFKLVVAGWTSATGFYALSDETLKKEIKKIENPLQKISSISGYTYYWNKAAKTNRNLDDNKQAGFLAQEIEKVLPEAVAKNDDGIYGLNYNAIMPLLAEGIKEQQTQISTQQSKIEKLELENENIKLQLSELKNKLGQLVPGDVKLKVASLEVAPNPITGTSLVIYKFDNANAVSILVISDLQGRIIKQINLAKGQASGQVQVSKSDLHAGMFVFSIVSGNIEVISKKVLVSE